jgi:uncharacterized protein (TIGR02001 family)
MKKTIVAVALAMATAAAHAELGGNFSITSDYRFRGISQTQGKAAIQGGIDYTHSSGFYVGNWNSSVSSEIYPQGSGLESDIYAGFTKEIGPVTFDVGALHYMYPGARTGATPDKFNTTEVYVGAEVGPFSAKVSQSVGDYFGIENSKKTNYYQVGADIPVFQGFTVNAHYGRTDVQNNTDADYNDYRVGATLTKAGFDWGAHYYGTKKTNEAFRATNTVNGEQNYDRGFVFTVSKTF